MSFIAHFSSYTDVGQSRPVNEDAEGHLIMNEGSLFIVCDGIGGYPGGDIASKLAVEIMQKYFPQTYSGNEPQKALMESISQANRAIREYAGKNPYYDRMGATLLALFVTKDTAYYAHVGDSRIYFVRHGELKQLTKDHSYVQELVDAGEIEAFEARSHPKKNMITRALGTMNPRPDIGESIALQAGDRFLLCTDGLTNAIRDTKIYELMMHDNVQQACLSLVFEANRTDGSDNITVQVIEIVEQDSDPAD